MYQFDGRGYGSPSTQYVVDRFRSSSGLAASDKNQIEYRFDYWTQAHWPVEFNSRTQTYPFEIAEVRQVNGAGANMGGSRTVFRMDRQDSRLNGQSVALIGTECLSRTLSSGGDTLLYSETQIQPHWNSSWPSVLIAHGGVHDREEFRHPATIWWSCLGP